MDGWRFFVVVSLYFDDTRYTPNRGGFRWQGGMDGGGLENGERGLTFGGEWAWGCGVVTEAGGEMRVCELRGWVDCMSSTLEV